MRNESFLYRARVRARAAPEYFDLCGYISIF